MLDGFPTVLSINLNWEYDYPMYDILKIFSLIPNSFASSDLYHVPGGAQEIYLLRGMVLYWNFHYMSIFRTNSKYGEWTLYDDGKINDFKSWEGVIKQCVKIGVRPTILFYERASKT